MERLILEILLHSRDELVDNLLLHAKLTAQDPITQRPDALEDDPLIHASHGFQPRVSTPSVDGHIDAALGDIAETESLQLGVESIRIKDAFVHLAETCLLDGLLVHADSIS